MRCLQASLSWSRRNAREIAHGLGLKEKNMFKWVTLSEASFEYIAAVEDGHQLAWTSEYTSKGQTVKDEAAADAITGTTTGMQ